MQKTLSYHGKRVKVHKFNTFVDPKYKKWNSPIYKNKQRINVAKYVPMFACCKGLCMLDNQNLNKILFKFPHSWSKCLSVSSFWVIMGYDRISNLELRSKKLNFHNCFVKHLVTMKTDANTQICWSKVPEMECSHS